jgi:hypothetical protein
LGKRRRHERIEIAVEHIGWHAAFHAGPEIFNELIGLKDV